MDPRGPTLTTDRLVLRRWQPSDLDPFAALNADPVTMEHLPSLLTRGETEAYVERIEATFEERGFGLWVVEVPGVTPFAGYTGLWPAEFEAHFTPAVEIGWRLAADHWGQGYATEAARSVLRFGFDAVGLDEIVSFTAVVNARSEAVMQRIGMARDGAGDFEHPSLPEGHRLRRHVLYRLPREAWA